MVQIKLNNACKDALTIIQCYINARTFQYKTQTCHMLPFYLKCILPPWYKNLDQSTYLPNAPCNHLFIYLSFSKASFLKPHFSKASLPNISKILNLLIELRRGNESSQRLSTFIQVRYRRINFLPK